MLFVFLVSILAFAIAIRAFEQLIDQKFFSRGEMTKIGTAYLGGVGACAAIFPTSYRSIWCALFIPLLLALVAAFINIRRRARRFRAAFRETLNAISVKMKTGRSFRQALGEASAECDPKFRVQVSEIASAVVFSQQIESLDPHSFIAEIVSELTRIDQNPHASLRRLEVFRQKLRTEDDFRRRSGQVLARIRAQSVVMTFLYVAIFTFMIWKFGWRPNATPLSISALLFSGGGVWIHLSGKRIRWKV